jgi:threonine synthase
LKDAVLTGLAPDGGLFMPEKITALSSDFFSSMQKYSFQDLCYEITQNFIGPEIPASDLRSIVNKSITFPAPIHSLTQNLHVLELWHGPSLAFKDFGAQFMAQLMSYYNSGQDQDLNILVATSGDTGSAIASGFHKVPGINIIILFPKGKVSPLQEKQMTTYGDNVSAIEVAGTFDDCQYLVKAAFSDTSLCSQIRLSSANSINIARLIPQMFYYFEAYRQLPEQTKPTVFSVPSGNFGNLTAGLFSKKMGLPVEQFLATTNINDVVPEYLKSQVFSPRPSKETLSNAMDVGNPSNFARILNLYSSTWNIINDNIIGLSFNDQETIEAIKEVYNLYHYLLDPHGSVGYLGAKQYIQSHPHSNVIILETAHPSKFKSVMDEALQNNTPIHPTLAQLEHRPSSKTTLPSNYDSLKEYLLDTL